MSEKVKYDSPGERMNKLLLALKRKRSMQGLRTAVSEVLQAGPGDMKEFSYKIGNHKWRGVIFLKRNSLMGSVVSLFDTKLFVVRGFPKVKYSDDSRVYLKGCVAQEKIDGSNFGIFALPDGTLMAKTRMAVNWDSPAYKRKDKTWHQLFAMIDNGDLLKRLNELAINRDCVVYGELYGRLNKGDFISYSVDIAFKVFDILDCKKQRFLPPETVSTLCEFYGLPMVKQIWNGILTDKEIQRIEFELQQEVKEDGMEGMVAKTYFTDEDDVYCCKLKCEAVKEKCWEESKPIIPMGVIRKCIRKILENFPELKTIEEIEPHTLEELREDVEEPLIQASMDRIRTQIRRMLTPEDEDLLKLVVNQMKEMQTRGADLSNKGHILSSLAVTLGKINGTTLYRFYQQALRELG